MKHISNQVNQTCFNFFHFKDFADPLVHSANLYKFIRAFMNSPGPLRIFIKSDQNINEFRNVKKEVKHCTVKDLSNDYLN